MTAILRYGGLTVLPPAWVAVLGAWLILGLILRRRTVRQASTLLPDRPVSATPPLTGALVRPATRYAFAALLALFLVNLNSIYTPAALNGLLLLDAPLHVADNEQMVLRALAIKEITKPNATIALVWAGIMPYFADR